MATESKSASSSPKSDFSIEHILTRAGVKKETSPPCFPAELTWLSCTRYCPPKLPSKFFNYSHKKLTIRFNSLKKTLLIHSHRQIIRTAFLKSHLRKDLKNCRLVIKNDHSFKTKNIFYHTFRELWAEFVSMRLNI